MDPQAVTEALAEVESLVGQLQEALDRAKAACEYGEEGASDMDVGGEEEEEPPMYHRPRGGVPPRM